MTPHNRSGIGTVRKDSSELSNSIRNRLELTSSDENPTSVSSLTGITDILSSGVSVSSHQSADSKQTDMLGGSQTTSRTSTDRLSSNAGTTGDVLSPTASTKGLVVESSSGGMLAAAAPSLNSSAHSSNTRVSLGSVDRLKNGSPIDDVHVDSVSITSHHTLSDRLSTGSIHSSGGKNLDWQGFF